jgi:hypothetical protein
VRAVFDPNSHSALQAYHALTPGSSSCSNMLYSSVVSATRRARQASALSGRRRQGAQVYLRDFHVREQGRLPCCSMSSCCHALF